MEALIELIDSYEGLSDQRIIELVSRLDWNFISTVLGFDPREEDPDSGEIELAEFLACDVSEQLLEAAALIVNEPIINHLVESDIQDCPLS